MSTLVLTMCVGFRYSCIGEITLPRLEAYAHRMGAEFLCLQGRNSRNITPSFDRFVMRDLLQRYERIVYIDADCLVRNTAPSLFDVVPDGLFGAFNEGPWSEGYGFPRKQSLINSAKLYDVPLGEEALVRADTEYYNAGVLVVSSVHRELFELPDVQYEEIFYEQSLINARLFAGAYQTFDIGPSFNFMPVSSGHYRLEDANIIHYAGNRDPVESFINNMQHDLQRWGE